MRKRHSKYTGIVTVENCKMWYVDGKLHREDGPALIYLDGDVEWWFNDYQLPFEYWCQATKKSEEEIVRLKLTYC